MLDYEQIDWETPYLNYTKILIFCLSEYDWLQQVSDSCQLRRPVLFFVVACICVILCVFL